MKVLLHPLVGIEIENVGEISLGTSINDVLRILPKPHVDRNSYYFYNSELRIFVDENGKVDFIECLNGVYGAKLNPYIYGAEVYKTKAEDLVSLLAKQNDGNIEDNEYGYSYVFPNISVGVYRECLPEDVEEMIQEINANGDYERMKEEIQLDLIKANYFATIGIGQNHYYR